MTPATQKEYIITDKMLKFFASQSFACEQVAAQARPYTGAGSDAVLDELENWVRDAMSRAENPKGWLFRTGDMLEKFAELRQQKEREQQ